MAATKRACDPNEDFRALVSRERLLHGRFSRVDRTAGLVRAGLRDSGDEVARVGRSHLLPVAGLDPLPGDQQPPVGGGDGHRLKPMPPETRYARSGDVNIAYQVVGDGPLDLVLVSGFVSHLDVDWEEPGMAHFLRRLGSFSRLIRFDKRGTGLSDRPGGLPDLETRMDDVRAVMDAVGSEQAALFGYSEGGPMSCLFAATYPERISSLVLYGSYAKRRDPDDDYPWAATSAERRAFAEQVEREWGFDADLGSMAPNADAGLRAWWAKRSKAAASPGAARDLILMNSEIDVRAILPTIQVPALVLHRVGDRDSRAEEGRYIAEHIPGARFVELEGDDHVVSIRPDEIVDEVQEFLTGVRPAPEPERVLATVLFTDIVGSTERAAELGDRRWRELLERHNAVIRRELDTFSGSGDRNRGRWVPRDLRRARAGDPVGSSDTGRDAGPRTRAPSRPAHR